MKGSGIVRNLDLLGRIVVPKEIRKQLFIDVGDPIEIIKDNDTVILRKYSNGCVFCGSEEDIIEFNEKYVCRKCREKLDKI